MSPIEHLSWPFFEPRHREFAVALDGWALRTVRDVHAHDIDAQCRQLVKQLGEAGWLAHAVAGIDFGGAAEAIDTRMLCLARETLARHNGLADFAFAMQGLGSGAISRPAAPSRNSAGCRRWRAARPSAPLR